MSPKFPNFLDNGKISIPEEHKEYWTTAMSDVMSVPSEYMDKPPTIDKKWKIHPKWNKIYRVIEWDTQKSHLACIVWDGSESGCLISTPDRGVLGLTIPHASSKYDIEVWNSTKFRNADEFLQWITHNGKGFTEILPPYNPKTAL